MLYTYYCRNCEKYFESYTKLEQCPQCNIDGASFILVKAVGGKDERK